MYSIYIFIREIFIEYLIYFMNQDRDRVYLGEYNREYFCVFMKFIVQQFNGERYKIKYIYVCKRIMKKKNNWRYKFDLGMEYVEKLF